MDAAFNTDLVRLWAVVSAVKSRINRDPVAILTDISDFRLQIVQ